MGLMNEYIQKIKSGWQPKNFEDELLRLIKEYNKLRSSYLLVYSSAVNSPIDQKIIMQEDYYIIHDLLKDKSTENLDVYLETPGGLGEVAEDIVKLLHNKSQNVSFIISGQAKSAGTIIALSGHEIFMTETGSLGPIDAQIRIGRSVFSAHDYIEWVNKKRGAAAKSGKLNPFDAIMIAQITPGELSGVLHSLRYAQDLVVEWLPKYKFKNWNVTQDRQIPVTAKMKEKQARRIATELTKHSRWRTHGRSLKIQDLLDLGLIINRVEDNPKLADIVYRIQAVTRFLFDNTTSFKIFATVDEKIFRQAAQPKVFPGGPQIIQQQQQQPDAVNIDHKCQKCGTINKFYLKLRENPLIDQEMKKLGIKQFPINNKYSCKCGALHDLINIRQQIEANVIKNKPI
jgi:hypothetical protein